MEIFTKSTDLKEFINKEKQKNKLIGFVPTMGALHLGHASLVEKSKNENEVTVVSIFVNPTQFNNESDYINYPITTEQDLALLKSYKVDAVFLPSKQEIYVDEIIVPEIKLGELNKIMEGEYRIGHFEGVVNVVFRLFNIVNPDNSYFGLKDFQQVAVIKRMTEQLNLGVKIIPCPTIREKDGLALSSRNLRLSESQRIEAKFIFNQLNSIQSIKNNNTPFQAKKIIEREFAKSPLKLEYIEIIDKNSFEILKSNWSPQSIACIAAYLGEIRLIDNIEIN